MKEHLKGTLMEPYIDVLLEKVDNVKARVAREGVQGKERGSKEKGG